MDHLDEVSRAGTETALPTLAEVVHYQLHFGKTAQFHETLPKFAGMMEKFKPSVRFEWFEVLEGGETPAFVMIAPRTNWAAFQILKESIMVQMIQLMGKQRAMAALERLSAAVKSQRRDLVRLRQDLSYLRTSFLPRRDQ